MNKKLILILSIVIVVIIAVALYFVLSTPAKEADTCPIEPKTCLDGSISTPTLPDCKHTCAEDLETPTASTEESCIASGGTVSTSSCCASSSDFPNSCTIGACGCGPEDSKEVKVCTCPEGQCFDGSACLGSATEAVPAATE